MQRQQETSTKKHYTADLLQFHHIFKTLSSLNMNKFTNIFVTVGTTQFEELIGAIFSPNILALLQKYECRKLTVQLGSGTEIEESAIHLAQQKYGIQSVCYRLKPTILDNIREADLVISHAGAGSCIEVLKAKKPLLVVVNDGLMDNHQTELAEQLFNDGFLLYCTPNTVPEALEKMRETTFSEYEPGNAREFVRQLDSLMGF